MGGFPGVIGCVDGTHIRITSPKKNIQRAYVNRKSYHSINVCGKFVRMGINFFVQAICDHTGAFLHVSAKWPGSTHDSFAFKNTAAWDAFESGLIEGLFKFVFYNL